MTKRSLAFIILMTLTFFLFNYYFTSKRLGEERTKYEEQQKTTTSADFEDQVLKAEELPIVQLKNPKSGQVIEAIQLNSLFFVREKGEQKAEELDWKGNSLPLLFEVSQHIPFLVYSTEDAPTFSSVHLPKTGQEEVHLVTFHKEDTQIQASLGVYENGRIYFPQSKPADYALTLVKQGQNLIPVGIYNPHLNRFYDFSQLPEFQKIVTYEKAKPAPLEGKERYYVLENDYQQLVFSNVDGSLVEINLPFKSEENPNSVVRPINFDREITKQSETNSYFPLHPYQIAENSKEVTKQPALGGYTPLIRRSLIGPSGSHTYSVAPPRLYALNVQNDNDGPSVYQLKRLEKNLIEFELVQDHRRIVKTFSFPEDSNHAPYVFDVNIKIEGSSRGLTLTSGVPEVELISGSYSPVLKYQMQRGQKSSVEKIKLPKNGASFGSVHPNWVSNSNGFFGIIMDPLQEIGAGFSAEQIQGNLDPTRLTLIDPEYNLYPADKYPGYLLKLPLGDRTGNLNFRVFAGPYATSILKRVDTAYTDPTTGYSPNYLGAQSFHGWFAFISEPFAKFLFMLMQIFYKFTHSWGFSIILLTVALRVMLYPLNTWSIKSNLRMQGIQPKVAALQEKFKKDPKRLQMEIMQLYRKEKANPFTGCLPILIQMPFLVGMFDLLKSNFDLRGASFIPGWINNLTSPDVLFSWKYPIPFIGTEFHFLPILLGVVMYFQQKVSMKKGAAKTTDQQKQQKMMGNIFTVVFTFLFYNLPSGLNIYFLSSMGLQFLQQWYMSKKVSPQKKENLAR